MMDTVNYKACGDVEIQASDTRDCADEVGAISGWSHFLKQLSSWKKQVVLVLTPILLSPLAAASHGQVR